MNEGSKFVVFVGLDSGDLNSEYDLLYGTLVDVLVYFIIL